MMAPCITISEQVKTCKEAFPALPMDALGNSFLLVKEFENKLQILYFWHFDQFKSVPESCYQMHFSCGKNGPGVRELWQTSNCVIIYFSTAHCC